MIRTLFLLLVLLPVLFTAGCTSSSSFDARYARSQQALYEGDYESASRSIRELLKDSDESVEVLSLALEHALVTEDIRRALELIDRLILVDQDSWYRYYGIKALMLLEAGQKESAVQLYRERHEHNPYDLENGLILIGLLREQGRAQEAGTVARTLYTYHPDSQEVLEILADVSVQESAGWSEVLDYEKTLR